MKVFSRDQCIRSLEASEEIRVYLIEENARDSAQLAIRLALMTQCAEADEHGNNNKVQEV